MITIKDIREKVIRSFIAKELLEDSIYPSLEQICSIALSRYKDIDAYSTMLTGKYALNINDPASQEWINSLYKIVKIDIKTIYMFIDYLYNYLSYSYITAINKMNSLTTTTNLLLTEVKELELLSNNFNKNINIISDNFYTTNKINTLLSDAKIDLNNHRIRSKNIDKQTLRYVTDNIKECIPTIVTQGHNTFKIDGDTINLFSGNKKQLVTYVDMPSHFIGNVIIMLDISFKNEEEFNQILFSIGDNTTQDIQIMALIDGVYKTIADYTTYITTANVIFDTIKTKHILLFLRTSTFETIDKTKNTKRYKFVNYDFQIGIMKFAEISTLYTNSFSLNNKFSQISLSVNEIIRSSSNIRYYISHGLNDTWSDFLEIVPINRENTISNTTISVIGSFVQNTDDVSLDFDKIHTYINGYNVATNYTVSDLNHLSLRQPKLIRNLNNINVNSNKKEGSVVLFVKTNDITVDFTLYNGYLNGTFINKLSILKPGIYNFTFSLINGINRYLTFFNNHVTNNIGNFYFGTHIAKYIDDNLFINHIENNNYTYFTFITIDASITAIVKEIDKDEKMLIIEQTTGNFNINNLPNQIKMKIDFLSDNTDTAQLLEYQIKTL